ncbi:unnamed protein product [Nippostrongylus brasiliensis]|uniref:SCP domain-containing protein n=1 Tax=Nippostrongylus brasiliensis TaxID=27835 RepID=A0A0N4YQ15_NIPBR|nr:unnamed protein product [Nippostrongylus brasiliensis]
MDASMFTGAADNMKDRRRYSKRIIKVLPICTSTLYESDFICSDKTQENARKEVLNKFNEIRTTVAKGDAESLNGAIPAAGNMYKLIYDCDLEEMATLMISGCPARKPTITRAFNLDWLAKDKTTKDAVETWEKSLSTNPVKWPKNNILPDPATIAYYPYATMVNFNATAVGCANEYCKYDAQNEKANYSCALEGEALTYAKTCPGSGSSQEGKSENFYNGSASDMVQAADKMAWATVNEIGCGVAQCGSVYNVVCRYNPPGNIVGSPVYEIGPPTFQCPPGTQPDARYTGLCA